MRRPVGNYHPANPAIANEQISPAAQHKHRHFKPAGDGDGLHQFSCRIDRQPDIGRAAQPGSCVPGQGFVEAHPVAKHHIEFGQK